MEIFGRRIATHDELRAHYREPSDLVRHKKFGTLDGQFREFVELSPFCLVATTDALGNTDVSPRGGPPGFVRVIDERHLLLPDLSGNNLLDSLSNVIDTPSIGLLFLVPGADETVRVNGRACVTVDPDLLSAWDTELRRPKAAIGIEVVEVFHHCAKAFRRSGMWQPDSWAAPGVAPDFCATYNERLGLEIEPLQLREMLEQGYAADLAEERPTGGD